MRKISLASLLVVAAAVLVFDLRLPSASATVVSGGGTNIRSAQDILGCADVRAFGAVVDGVHDDTAAFQAAVNSGPANGGPVCLAPGVMKVTGSIMLRKSTAVLGFNPSSPDQVSAEPDVSVIDASTVSNSIVLYGAGNGVGVRLEGFRLKLSASPGSTNCGIYIPQCNRCSLRNLSITKGYAGIRADWTQGLLVENVWADLQANVGIRVYNATHTTILGSMFSNVSGAGTSPANIRIENGSLNTLILVPVVDEAFAGAASVLVLNAQNTRIIGPQIFYTHAGGAGYGIRLGDGTNNPTDVSIEDVRVERFSAGPAPLAGISIAAGASQVKLRNVRVDVSADSGTVGISDLATDTRWDAVTVTTTGGTIYTAIKDPSMPSASPGAGSKQVWYDPADSNRMKFAP